MDGLHIDVSICVVNVGSRKFIYSVYLLGSSLWCSVWHCINLAWINQLWPNDVLIVATFVLVTIHVLFYTSAGYYSCYCLLEATPVIYLTQSCYSNFKCRKYGCQFQIQKVMLQYFNPLKPSFSTILNNDVVLLKITNNLVYHLMKALDGQNIVALLFWTWNLSTIIVRVYVQYIYVYTVFT